MSKEIVRLIRKESTKSKLRSFLDEKEPELAYFLQTLWNNQGRAITYKELREAILSGEMRPEWLEAWQQDYSRFVTKHLLPMWVEAMRAGTKELPKMSPGWYFNPSARSVQNWMETRGAAFVTNSTSAQIEGLRALLRHAIADGINVDALSRAIRPMVGLTYQQSIANANYLQTLRENGMSDKQATDKAIRYAARQHRYRGYNIARTELAFAYNQGALQGARQAQAQGYLGEVVKVWRTANDDIPEGSPNYQRYRSQGLKPRRTIRGTMAIGRTCEVCQSLDGTRIELDEDFPFRTKLTTPGIREGPPAHPRCRCSIQIVEISLPLIETNGLQEDQRYDIIEDINPSVSVNTGGIVRIKNSELKNGLPIKGKPNSIVDKISDNGEVLQRRLYDADGKASTDFDTTDHDQPYCHPTGAHKHTFDYSKRRPRSRPKPLTEEELQEHKDIIKWGENYHDPT